MSGDKRKELGVTPIARFVGYKAVGADPKIMGIGLYMRFLEVLSSAIYLLKTLIWDRIERSICFSNDCIY